MLMPFGKFKGWEVSKLPAFYLEWLKKKDPPIYGPLELAVHHALGLPAPNQRDPRRWTRSSPG